MKTNTNSNRSYADLAVQSYSLLAPKQEGLLPKVVMSFEHNGTKLYWSRNLHTAKSVIEESPELSEEEAKQVAKEKNSNALKGLEAVGFDKEGDIKSFNPIGVVANCTIEEQPGYGFQIAFLNKVKTHVKMNDEDQAKLLSELF